MWNDLGCVWDIDLSCPQEWAPPIDLFYLATVFLTELKCVTWSLGSVTSS